MLGRTFCIVFLSLLFVGCSAQSYGAGLVDIESPDLTFQHSDQWMLKEHPPLIPGVELVADDSLDDRVNDVVVFAPQSNFDFGDLTPDYSHYIKNIDSLTTFQNACENPFWPENLFGAALITDCQFVDGEVPRIEFFDAVEIPGGDFLYGYKYGLPGKNVFVYTGDLYAPAVLFRLNIGDVNESLLFSNSEEGMRANLEEIAATKSEFLEAFDGLIESVTIK